MALDLSKLNFFSRLDARARVVVLFLIVLGIIILVYLGTTYFAGGDKTLGPSRVASAPAGLQSIPGGTTQSAEYQRALSQANIQRAEAAKMSGGSSVPTQINTGVAIGLGSCVICSDESANVKNLLDDWIRQGKVTPEVSDMLGALANKNVTVDEYAAALNQLVKEGKLTPEQARALLDEYKKQHMNAMLNETGKVMDDLIKSNQLPLEAANDLLDTQKKGASQAEYSVSLQKMVREGKISPTVAQQLLQQFNKQCLEEAKNKHTVTINQMSSNGSVTPDVAKQLTDLTKSNVSIEGYIAELNRLVGQGKLTPVAAGNLAEAYRQVKAVCGSAGTISELLRQAENEAYQELSDLLSAGKISPETAAQLSSLIQNNVPLDDYKTIVNQLLQEKKLTPEIAQLKIGDYEKVKKLREAQQQLADLQANNTSPTDYAEALKRLVAAGIITPEQAAQLLQEYQALTSTRAASVPLAGGQFGVLQQKVQEGASGEQAPLVTGDFAQVQAQVVEETAQDRQTRLDALMTAMTGQATQLISSWQPPIMQHREGTPDQPKGKHLGVGDELGIEGAGPGSGGLVGASSAAPLIKAGTIIFGVLDTAVNSDYPDSPIMVTIVEGKYKGAKLLGKITTTKGVSGQMDRVSLNFTLMNLDSWPKSKGVTAYAIDPDTARTVLASTVDYHYLMRYGAMIATSFLQGYSTAITNEGETSVNFGTTTSTHPELSPSNKLMVGLGQVGQNLGTATQNYINRPPTVRVDSGVSLGILFMADVT